MNFPDLETCRAIGAEFPDSEFVWASFKEGVPYVEKRDNIGVFGKADKIIANAPICEELGEWLNGNFAFMGINGTEFEKIIMSCFWHYTKTETQARAEAVKLIMETKLAGCRV